MATSKFRWLVSLEDQPALVEKAVAGDKKAQEKLLACYDYLFGRLTANEESKTDKEDLKGELITHFLSTVLPALIHVGFRGFPAYINICLIHARNAFWKKYRPGKKPVDIDITEIAAKDSPIDTETAKQILWDMLENQPEMIWQSKIRSAGWIPRFARQFKIPTHELRLKVVQTMVRAGATPEQMRKTFGACGQFWLMNLAELSKLRVLATDKQRKALELYLAGYSKKEIAKILLDPDLLLRLLQIWKKGQREPTFFEYFRRLNREHLILAIQLAAPVQLRILQECLRGKNHRKIQEAIGHRDSSNLYSSLKSLRKRLEKELAKRSIPSGPRRA